MRAGLPVPAGVALPVRFVDAVGEDSEQASFAGQHLTRLNLRSEPELVGAVCAIWDSARSPSALGYRERLGLPREPRMAVVVQELVDAESAGVLFSRNPLDGSDELVIEAAWGLGENVVALRIDPEGGTSQTDVRDELARALCLDDAQLAALHDLASRCDEVFGGSHDLEWAFASGRLYLLQRRTLTAIPRHPLEASV
jgi:pyruvate,water dikinase